MGIAASRLTRSPAAVGPQAIASPANRLDRVESEGTVDLLPQVADVDVDDVRAVVVAVVPGVLEQFEPRQDLAGAAHEGLEQRELLRRELDRRVAAPRPTCCRSSRSDPTWRTAGRS